MLLDTDPLFWGSSLVEAHPEAAVWTISSAESTVEDGRFELRLPLPHASGPMDSVPIVFGEISAVFVPDKDGYRHIEGTTVKSTNEQYLSPAPAIMLKGQLPERYSGKAVFYVAVRVFGLADEAHPRYLKAQEEMLDSYANVPLDGFTWDEPSKGIDNLTPCFKAGAGFLALFERLNGYPLRPNLIYLDRLDGTPRSVKVRCDYYRTLIEMNYRAQKRHNDYARRKFGEGLTFGTHQTWAGFPADLVAGDIDYFKLGKVLTAAWTDGGWDNTEQKYIVQFYMLAEGLKKELGVRDAYYNDWACSLPAVGNMEFANRLKMLFHINWYCYSISDFSEGSINYTQEPEKSAAAKARRNLDRFDRLVGETFAPHTDVAYLYSWETLAASPKWMTRMYFTFIANTALHLTDRGQYAAIMSGESIRKAVIGDRRFTVNGLSYRVLLLPYVNILEEAAYRKAVQINDAGVPVIVVGPPPEFTAEGKDLAADLRGGWVSSPSRWPNTTACWASRPLCRASTNGSRPGSTPPIRSKRQRPEGLQPGEPSAVRQIGRPAALLHAAARSAQGVDQPDRHADGAHWPRPTPRNTYYRFFPHRQDREQMVVVAVAKAHAASFGLAPGLGPTRNGSSSRPPIRPHYLKALFRFPDGGELTFNGGSWCAVRLDHARLAETIGDCPEVRWIRRPLP